ncbi:PROTEIN TIC 40 CHLOROPLASTIC [Salix viminalis]|uniref:PROTEIN TIC 40 CHLOROPLASTIC n=1 Tax=Salix viminalis TaxID=40686 RepID=A0A9Q0QIN8_SALVM|nr:PROTEIN TIC 40 CHLOROPLASTIC [Salix viminalis]
MENPRLALLSSSSPKLVMGCPTSLKNPTTPKFSISTTRPSLPFFLKTSITASHASRLSISALANSHGHRRTSKNGKLGSEYFASISSSSGKQTLSVGVNPQPVSPPPTQIGSPLFWVGVGVGLSAIFSLVAYQGKGEFCFLISCKVSPVSSNGFAILH